jgi:hypothetical protein
VDDPRYKYQRAEQSDVGQRLPLFLFHQYNKTILRWQDEESNIPVGETVVVETDTVGASVVGSVAFNATAHVTIDATASNFMLVRLIERANFSREEREREGIYFLGITPLDFIASTYVYGESMSNLKVAGTILILSCFHPSRIVTSSSDPKSEGADSIPSLSLQLLEVARWDPSSPPSCVPLRGLSLYSE